MPPPLNSSQKKLLEKIYYKDKVYVGRDKLFAYLRLYYPGSQISRRQVLAWLKDQNVHQLFIPTKKTKDIKATVLTRPYSQIGIDLADMQNYEYKDYNYILTAIDLFSKKAWARPIKGKATREVLRAMREILNEIGHPVRSIRSDNGSEFISKTFKNLLKSKNIKQVLSDSNKPQSNGQIENFNGIIKRMIKIHIQKTDSQDWVKVLPTLMRNYNNLPHSATKKVPNDLAEVKDEEKLEEVKENIKSAVLPKNESQDKIHNIGDKVRLKLLQKPFYKMHEKWTMDVFEIRKVFKPRKPFLRPYYYVKDKDGNEFSDRLYNNDIQVITKIENKVKAPKKFQISKILDKRQNGAQVEYKVKWLRERVPTWEPEASLKRDVAKMLKTYNQNH